MLNSIKIWHSRTSAALKHSAIKHLHYCGKRFYFPAPFFEIFLGKPQPISTYTKMQFTKYFDHCRIDLHSFEFKIQKMCSLYICIFCCSSLNMKLKIRYKQKTSIYMCTVTHKIRKLQIQTFKSLEGKCELWNISIFIKRYDRNHTTRSCAVWL